MFGRYELRSLIGVGGMGEVYEAYDTAKDRTVALKLLRTDFAADTDFQERFRRESRVAARLQEPHVIPVHDFGEIDGVLFIDMRRVEGSDVKTALARGGPMHPLRAARIVAQVASALDAAHAEGLVHRDVKPENILLTRQDFAYLVDFGIARVGGETGLTSAGSAVGSAAYMAPERFSGAGAGPASDVYALACVLYECLTGRTPFPAGDFSQLVGAHLMKPPPRVSAARQGLAAFDAVVGRGMAKRPGDRYPTAGTLARAASSAAEAPAVAPPSHPSLPRRPLPQPPTVVAQPDHRPAAPPQIADARTGFGQTQLVVLVAAIAVLAVAAVAAMWLLIDANRDQPVAQGLSPTTTAVTTDETTPRTTTRLSSSSSSSVVTEPAIPGTDRSGFVGNFARCNATDPAEVMARTTGSELVICRSDAGGFYYRGVRLSDGAGIELPTAIRAASGFDVVNPENGTRYEVRPGRLTIVSPDGETYVEQMVQYAPQ